MSLFRGELKLKPSVRVDFEYIKEMS